MYQYSFEKLDVWIESKNFAKIIYQTTNSFPESEKFNLTSQLRRAAVSIASNIAEGSARSSNKDKAHFTTMAFSSAIEVLNQLIICLELNIIDEIQYRILREKIESITNKLNSLRKHQLSK